MMRACNETDSRPYGSQADEPCPQTAEELEGSDLKHERKVAELRELIYETYLKMDLEKESFSAR